MVIGQDVESPDRNAAAEPLRPSCRALSNLPQIQSPGVVVQRVMNVVMPLRASGSPIAARRHRRW